MNEHKPKRTGPIRWTWNELDQANLPIHYLEILRLKKVGLSHEQIAAKLNIKRGTSKSRLARARDAMELAMVPS